MAYYEATNTGKGFITHADNESAHVAGYPGDIWGTTNTTWAARVGATSKTKSQAQAIVDADISGSYYMEGPDSGSQVVVTLP
jgi:hypothetical protein|tara:strand:- start:321 stop:566 length:246 start_codon:yes stop_codon:yes gene_type:complete